MSDQTPDIEPTLTPSGSLAPGYFDRLYAERADPWEFATSPYEAAKYEATLASLPRVSYARALELGCSIGVFTQQLAQRCERLLAIDVSQAALAEASARCRDLPHVFLERRDIAGQFPEGRFDLIVLSEVAYYFSMPDLERLRAQVAAALEPGGHVLLVHFTGITNYPLTAGAVHNAFLTWPDAPWRSLERKRNDGYQLDLFEK